jgi:hypothetical protein
LANDDSDQDQQGPARERLPSNAGAETDASEQLLKDFQATPVPAPTTTPTTTTTTMPMPMPPPTQ